MRRGTLLLAAIVLSACGGAVGGSAGPVTAVGGSAGPVTAVGGSAGPVTAPDSTAQPHGATAEPAASPAATTPGEVPAPPPTRSEATAAPQPVDAPVRRPGPASVGEEARAGERPAWLGTRVLPKGPEGVAPPQPTPPELVDRRLPPPPSDRPQPSSPAYVATVEPVPPSILARSTWTPACPVAAEDLRYVTLNHWGFDGEQHTGELLVHASVADDVAAVFGRLHHARFPLEEVRVVRADELDAPPTGDGNVTSGFVCRPAAGGSTWSQHAYGLAIDVNPFHNPYVRGGATSPEEALAGGSVVLPELATAYVDRSWRRPGMIAPGDAVTEAFASIGWSWGGDWTSRSDWMHFSANGG